MIPTTNAVAMLPCHRLVATRFPTVGPYDRVAAPEDLDVVFAVAALTNPRVRQELGQLSLVAPAERAVGPGASLIMAPYTHLNPSGSRFSDGSWGVYYAADSLATAVVEVSHHRAVFLKRTAEAAIDIDLRWLQADLLDKLHDVRGQGGNMPAVYDPDPAGYGAGQALGRALRADGSLGIAYDSVRRPQGQCVAIFKPKALGNARSAGHIGLHWDGRSHFALVREGRAPCPMTTRAAGQGSAPSTETAFFRARSVRPESARSGRGPAARDDSLRAKAAPRPPEF